MEKPPVSWEILFESWKHEVELSFFFFFTGFYFQHLWRLGRAAILSDTQCLRNTRSSCMCVRVARCSHDLFSKFVCPKFRIWFLLYSVNLSVKWHLGKGGKKKNVSDDESFVSAHKGGTGETKQSLLTRKILPPWKFASWLWKRPFPRFLLIPSRESIGYHCWKFPLPWSFSFSLFDLIASVFYQHTEVWRPHRTALALSRIVGKSRSCRNNRMMHRERRTYGFFTLSIFSSRNRPPP